MTKLIDIEKKELVSALIKGGYNKIDAHNVAYGDDTIAFRRYQEYCDRRITLSDLFIGNFRISQKFGANPAMYKPFGLKGHDGVDWACPAGTRLISPVSGTVISIKYDKRGYGTHVKILDWNQRCCVLFGHMKNVSVRYWQTVKTGQLIGTSGNTGFSTGPHLHFGLCLTNIFGYRLNRNNGYLGWVNCLDKTLIKWSITNPNLT